MNRNQTENNDEQENYENILKKMTKDSGVRGWIVVNWEGIPIKYHGYTDEEAVAYAGSIMSLVDKTSNFFKQPFVHQIISEDVSSIHTIQLRTPENEIIIAPSAKFVLIAIYDPTYVEPEKEEGEDDEDFI